MSKNALLKYAGVVGKLEAKPIVAKKISSIGVIRAGMNPSVGSIAEIVRLSPAVLMVDKSYQRNLVIANCKKIAKNWQWDLAGTISVAERSDGTYYVFDGQTRMTAAALRGDIPLLNCTVIQSTGPAMEAEAFLRQNRERTAIKSIDYHNASVVAEDAVALKIDEILTEYGITLTHSHPGVRKTTGIMNIRNQFERLKSSADAEQRLRNVLEVIAAAWPEDEQAYGGQFVRGVWRFVSSVEDVPLLLSKADDRLGRYSVKDIMYKATVQAKALGCHVSTTLPKTLLEQFNFNIRKNRLV